MPRQFCIPDTVTLVDGSSVEVSVPHPAYSALLKILYKGDSVTFIIMADTYRQDEIQEILQIAIARDMGADELSRQQLYEIADELGLTIQQIQSAEQDWLSGRQALQEHGEFQRYRRVRFRQHLIKYGITNGFLVLFDFTTFGDGTATLSFSLYIAMIWGLFVTLDGWRAFQTEGEAYERAFQGWRRRRWLRQSARRLMSWWSPSTALRSR